MRKPQAIVDARPNSSGYTGTCTHCGQPAAKEAHFKQDGVVVIEKYCAGCADPLEFAKLQKFYAGL